MRRGLVVVAALAGLCGLAGGAKAQVIYYSTPYYYNSPFNPTVRTYSTPVMYSTYTSPIVVPTRFVYPPFGTVGYDNPPNAIQTTFGTSASASSGSGSGSSTSGSSTTTDGSTSTTDGGSTTATTRPAGSIQPYPAFRQVGYSTYTTAPLPVGWVYYSGDAYNAPSSHFNTPYAAGPAYDASVPSYYSAANAANTGPMNYGAYASPYFQIQYGQGYGGWGMGRGWGGWGRGWTWGW